MSLQAYSAILLKQLYILKTKNNNPIKIEIKIKI